MKKSCLNPIFLAVVICSIISACGSSMDPTSDAGMGRDAGTGTDDAGTGADKDTSDVWGWISVLEWNDTCDQWEMKTNWVGGVRAYFAEEQSFPRALPHHLEFMEKVSTVGKCAFYDAMIHRESDYPDCGTAFDDFDIAFECLSDSHSSPAWCDEDQQCVNEVGVNAGGTGECEDLPEHWHAGTITIEGLKTKKLTMEPDKYDRYMVAGLQNDLFDSGDEIRVNATGGELEAFSLKATGVAHLDLATEKVELAIGQAAVVKWTPADVDSRVQVAIYAGSHDPNPLTVAILCDTADSDGQIEIAAELVDKFIKRSCLFLDKCSRITRYTREVKTPFGKEVELFVGSARNLMLLAWE